VVVFGSARFVDRATAQAQLEAAQQSGHAQELAKAQAMVRNAEHYENARVFAQLVARACSCLPDDEKLFICTGGGPGIMEAANRGAQEAGAPSVALNIALPHEQHPNPYVTPDLSFKFHYFALRKMHFMMRAKALVAFPGGFGTLDELFEVMTLVQTRKARPVPILLFGTAFWKGLINMDLLIEEGTISAQDLNLFHYVDTPEAAWQAICNFYQLDVS
ncbi:MAG: TIGR00730 family Rossman fold protein, partial [Limnohabitans sp.]|nr:TIGR00730 family Rossman fold protein [Limnohabitans sp.]